MWPITTETNIPQWRQDTRYILACLGADQYCDWLRETDGMTQEEFHIEAARKAAEVRASEATQETLDKALARPM